MITESGTTPCPSTGQATCGLATWGYRSIIEMDRELGSTTRGIKKCHKVKETRLQSTNTDSADKKYPKEANPQGTERDGGRLEGDGKSKLLASLAPVAKIEHLKLGMIQQPLCPKRGGGVLVE